MPEKETINAVFILIRMQEEYRAKGKKLYMYFVNQEKTIYKASRKVMELEIRKKGIPEALVRSVIGLYEEAKTKVRWIPGCQRSMRLKWECTKDLCSHLIY